MPRGATAGRCQERFFGEKSIGKTWPLAVRQVLGAKYKKRTSVPPWPMHSVLTAAANGGHRKSSCAVSKMFEAERFDALGSVMDTSLLRDASAALFRARISR